MRKLFKYDTYNAVPYITAYFIQILHIRANGFKNIGTVVFHPLVYITSFTVIFTT
jgi:hypothetical protein